MGWILGWLKRFFPNLFSRAGAFIVGFVGPLIAPVMTFLPRSSRRRSSSS